MTSTPNVKKGLLSKSARGGFRKLSVLASRSRGVRAILPLALSGFSVAAMAQSNVTLFGAIDNGFQYQSGLPKGHAFSAESGGYTQSEFGLKGTEDIGGGTKTNFRLEMRHDSQNGAIMDGSFFAGEAIVGLSNDKWGAVNFGYVGQYEIMQDSWDLDPQLMQSFSIATLVRGRNWSAAGNSIEYQSPTWYGFSLKGQYDLANSTHWNAGNPGSGPGQLGGAQGRSDGLKLQYEADPFQFVAIYDEIRDPDGKFSNVYVASRSAMVGGTYKIGSLKFYAGYQHLSAPDADEAGYFGSATGTVLPNGARVPSKVDHEWVGVNWQATSADAMTVGVYHANANNNNGNATLYTLGATHNLSKRTFLYSEVGYVHNSKTSNVGLGDGYADPYGPNANNDPVNGGGNQTPNYGQSQLSVIAGIVHRF